MQPAVETHALAKRFGAIEAVRGIDLSVGRGELFGLVGPDGAGKTTTIRMLCGIVPPTSGDAHVLGYHTQRERHELVKHIGYLSQRFSLYGDLTVDENIQFFAEIHGVYDFAKRRDELLAFTRLAPARDRLADKLSGGMKQKLALACTLIHSPDLIVLDEPTTGVDPVSRRDFWVILSAILQQGITIIMATPYLDEAERCTRIAMMSNGVLLDVDTPQNIKKKMPGRVIEIICDPVREAFHLLRASAHEIEVQLFGDRLHVITPADGATEQRVLSILKSGGITIEGSHEIPPRLENVFITMMRDAAGGVA